MGDGVKKTELLVTMSVADLQRVVRDAVHEELANARPEPDAVMTCAEVAELLDVHPYSVPKLVKRDGLPGHRLGASREWRFIRSEVFAWLRSRKGAA